MSTHIIIVHYTNFHALWQLFDWVLRFHVQRVRQSNVCLGAQGTADRCDHYIGLPVCVCTGSIEAITEPGKSQVDSDRGNLVCSIGTNSTTWLGTTARGTTTCRSVSRGFGIDGSLRHQCGHSFVDSFINAYKFTALPRLVDSQLIPLFQIPEHNYISIQHRIASHVKDSQRQHRRLEKPKLHQTIINEEIFSYFPTSRTVLQQWWQ